MQLLEYSLDTLDALWILFEHFGSHARLFEDENWRCRAMKRFLLLFSFEQFSARSQRGVFVSAEVAQVVNAIGR